MFEERRWRRSSIRPWRQHICPQETWQGWETDSVANAPVRRTDEAPPPQHRQSTPVCNNGTAVYMCGTYSSAASAIRRTTCAESAPTECRQSPVGAHALLLALGWLPRAACFSTEAAASCHSPVARRKHDPKELYLRSRISVQANGFSYMQLLRK